MKTVLQELRIYVYRSSQDGASFDTTGNERLRIHSKLELVGIGQTDSRVPIKTNFKFQEQLMKP